MLIKSFSDDWKWWVWNYVKTEKNKENLFVILLNHGFQWDLISGELNYVPKSLKTLLRRQSQKIIDTDTYGCIFPLFKGLADNPRAHRIENEKVELYEVEDFISDDLCDFFIKKIDSSSTKSTVTNPEAEKDVRTSSTSFLRISDCEITKKFNSGIHEFIGIPINNGEEPQGQVYQVGQEFKSHCDWFDPNSAYNEVFMDKGQRTWTFMIYLNDVEEGGHTKFTKIDIDFKPKKRTALFWNNILSNGKGNGFTEHWGMPIISGSKYIITKWFREHDGTKKV